MRIFFHTNNSLPGIAQKLKLEGHNVISSNNIFQSLRDEPQLVLHDHIPSKIEIDFLQYNKIQSCFVNPCNVHLIGDCSSLVRAYGLRVIKPTTNWIYKIQLEIWFCNGDPIYQYNISVIQDRFLCGDIGPEIEPQSIVTYPIKNTECNIVNRLFTKDLLRFFKTAEYNGPISILAAISEDDGYPYFVKFHPGFSLTIYNVFHLVETSFVDVLQKIIDRDNPKIYMRQQFASSLCFSYYPYPFSNVTNGHKIQVNDNQKNQISNVYHQGDIQAYAVGQHTEWKEARKIAYNLIPKDKDLQYRIDGGIQAEIISKLIQ